jgi:hypothetical protein
MQELFGQKYSTSYCSMYYVFFKQQNVFIFILKKTLILSVSVGWYGNADNEFCFQVNLQPVANEEACRSKQFQSLKLS